MPDSDPVMETEAAAPASLAAIFAQLPAAVAVLRGPEHRFELTNDAYRELVGGRDMTGMTVREALPEVEGQGFFDLLDRVYSTGEPYYGSETPVLLDRDGSGNLTESFVNFVYLPIRDSAGEVHGIVAHAVDVTELVKSRRTVEALVDELAAQQRRLAAMVEQMPAGVVIAEVPTGRLLAANEEWRTFFDVAVDSIGNIAGYAVFSAHRPDGHEYQPDEYPLARTVSTGEVVVGEQMTIRRGDGARRIIEVNSAPIVEDGRVETAVATFFDVTDQRRTATLVERNKALLELVAEGAPLEVTLESVVRMIEEHAGGDVLASVLLVDADGAHLRHGAAPSLPDEYNRAIDGIEIGESVGCCGAAAHLREPVVATDIASDPRWEDFRELALGHGLRACWSTPVLSSKGDVLATFAIYSQEPGEPIAHDRELVDIATRTVAVAVERKRLEEEREELLGAERAARGDAERNLQVVEALHRVGLAVNASLDLQEVVQVVTDAATELTRAEFGAFFYNVVREDGEAYTLYTLSGAPRSAFERFPMPRNTKIFDPTFTGRAVVRIADVRTDPRYGQNPPYNGMPEGHLPVRSYLAVPVKSSDGEVLGGLFFGHQEVGVFTPESERLAVGVAAQAAIAIERARLYVREQSARAEAERRAQAALSLEHVNDGVCLVDSDGVVRVWNPAATTITGLEADDVVGRSLGDALPALAAVAEEIPTVRAPETASRTSTLPVEIGERTLWLAISGIRFTDGIVYTFRDRSEERRVEQMRSDIVATVSHELRTPLAALYGAARTLGRPEVVDDVDLRDQFVRMIETETERLTRVVNQILLTSELDGGSPGTGSTEPVDVVALARKVLELAELRSEEVSVELRSEDVPPVVADADKLQQVVANLVDNALKYGADGERVIVDVRASGDRVRLSVTDFGPGIPRHEAERVFERFYRLDPQQRSGVAGTGLGLHITRGFVREMGGDVWVEPNTDANGSTFVVELPATPAP